MQNAKTKGDTSNEYFVPVNFSSGFFQTDPPACAVDKKREHENNDHRKNGGGDDDVGFEGIATVCVFAWEERAADSCRHNLEQIRHYVDKYRSQ